MRPLASKPRLLQVQVAQYEKRLPELARWLEENVPQGLSVFALPANQHRYLCTTNPLERVHKEIKRRTRVAGLFPNTASLLRLVSAIVMELSEEWECGWAYLPRVSHENENSPAMAPPL